MRCSLVVGLLVVTSSLLRAQDIEVMSQLGGRSLPQAYYERIRNEPDVFQLRDGWQKKLAAARSTDEPVQGTLSLAVVPVLFSDSDTPEPMISSSALQTRLFGPSASSTVPAYYSEVSHNKLKISGRVTEWTRTTLSRATVIGQSFGLGNDSHVQDWIRQAIANTDPTVDFGQFDNDGADGIPNSGDDDGKVDGVAFVFREIDAACGGNGIWPHRSRLITGGAAVTNDPRPNGQGNILVSDYIVLGARACDGQQPLEVNVFAHETGHVLGLPDFYDSSVGLQRDQRRWVVGCWDIMSAGSWGCGTGPQPSTVVPPHMGAYTKSILGWNSPTEVTNVGLKPQVFTLRPANETGDALSIRLSGTENLFVEYRVKQGYDVSLPASGIVVYHTESNRAFLPCATCPRTYSYALMEADGDSALVRLETAGGNRGAAGDAFGNTRTMIDDSTIPSTRLNSGASTFVRLSKMIIDAAQGVARVTVSLLPPQITIDKLVAALGLTPLAPAEQSLLDGAGNGNQRYDVGDFRAFLQIRASDP